jgi:hypothetical protein
MSFVTLEVDIEHGKVVPKEPGKLPQTGSGLLTILTPAPTTPSPLSPLAPLEAFKTLQRELQLTPEKAEAWKAAIRDARRLSAVAWEEFLCGPLASSAESV